MITHICKNCGKEFKSVEKKSKFCCKSCACTYNNLHRTSTTKGKTKTVKCIKCNKDIVVSLHSNKSSHICEQCKKMNAIIDYNNHHKNLKTYKQLVPKLEQNIPCKVCGRLKCNDDFCRGGNGGVMRRLYSLVQFGLDPDSIGTNRIFEEYEKVKSNLYDLYVNKQLSTVEIAKLFNYKYNAAHVIYSFGIPIRNWSKSQYISNLKETHKTTFKSNIYKSQWYKTWNNKDVYLHSSYELDYAKYLDENKIDYEVEYLRIKYYDSQQERYRCAIPDFYIPSTNTIVEIKSNWTYDEQNMKDKFKAYEDLGYTTKLVLDHKEINLYDL